MELKITITQKNKDKVQKILDMLLEEEGEISVGIEKEKLPQELQTEQSKKSSLLLLKPSKNEAIPTRKGKIPKSSIGTWAMFNSFFPGKGAIRILANLLKSEKRVELNKFADISAQEFRDYGLGVLRGFPNSMDKSSVGRLRDHLIWPFVHLGMLAIEEVDGIFYVYPTKEGLEFASLTSSVYDNNDTRMVLTEEEKKYLLNHLEKADKEGFGELSYLKRFLNFLKGGNITRQKIAEWFASDKLLKEDRVKNSRRKADSDEFTKQLFNLGNTYGSSKVALLRELGVIENKRNSYAVIGDLK